MAISTTTTIQIAGETLTRFSTLEIKQNVNAHHTFSIVQPLPKEFVDQAIEKSQSYMGQSIKIEIKSSMMTTEAPLVFYGIVTQAELVRENGSSGYIAINGYSATIALEGSPTTRSYTDKSLTDIIQEITNNYPQKEVKPTLDIKNNPTLPYTVQYNESDFGFISRMAIKKGEWFYYNGETLLFGKPKSKTITLEYGRSLHFFKIGMNAKPLGTEYIGYDPSSADTQRADTKEINHQPKGYAKNAFDASNKLFPDKGTTLYSQPLAEGGSRTHLVDRATTQMQSRAANLITAKCESDETGVRLGDVVTIHESAFSPTGNPLDGMKEQNFGSYIITSITHYCEESGKYHNTFEGVPESVQSPPYGDVHQYPTAATQPATVTDNNDPMGLGRIQVQMAWQKDNSEKTPWIRMTNPHAGGGKGHYFVPEIGEEVLVGFEGGNAEKPYALGAMYNGNESSGYSTAGNDKKVIQTRSQCKIVIDDAQGSIFLEDPSGNTALLDGKGSIIFHAPKNFTITAGENISMTAGQNISTNAILNITETAGVDKSLSVGMIHNVFVGGDSIMNITGKVVENITGDYESHTEKERVENAKEGVSTSAEGNIEKHSEKEVQNNSAEKTKLF
jgi:type VI secretion system secreted protein VgrG